MSSVNPRCLVVDVDDTISTHVNRDYENAIPHYPIITRLNAMRSAGWRIVYFTARGSISCDGDLERIERERRPVLEAWMTKHGVQYDELKFGKPIGVYYIDDKALRPEEFMSLDYKLLKGGSGATVEKVGDRIIKSASNAVDQAEWYRRARKYVRTPKVHSAYGDIIEMEVVKGEPLNDVAEKKDIDLLWSLINIISMVGDANVGFWPTMVERLKNASTEEYPYREEFLTLIQTDRITKIMNKNICFSHGDMTLENIILQDDGGLVFIDPNHPSGLYSSWLLDVGKLFQSLHYSYEERFSGGCNANKEILFNHLLDKVRSRTSLEYEIFYMIEFLHYVRMIRYKNPIQKKMVFDTLQRLGPLIVPR